MTTRPRLIVCADDYGFTPEISRSIRELIAARRISATSVMAASTYWPAEAAALKAVADDADVGLHVTLTDQTPIGAMPKFAPQGRFPRMTDVIKAGLARRLPLDEIRAEIERQYAAFVAHYGRAPSHIDGHHHVQQLPGVRDIVTEIAAREGKGRMWVRSAREKPARILKRGMSVPKAMLLSSLGGGVARRATSKGVPVNQGFSGAYDVSTAPSGIAAMFERFLVATRENGLIMCHPGHSDAVLAALDVMTTARDIEHAFFMSEQWPAMLTAVGVELGPYRHSARI